MSQPTGLPSASVPAGWMMRPSSSTNFQPATSPISVTALITPMVTSAKGSSTVVERFSPLGLTERAVQTALDEHTLGGRRTAIGSKNHVDQFGSMVMRCSLARPAVQRQSLRCEQ